MSIKKWLMKQYWRVGTIRSLASLALGMLILGRHYYEFLPPLANMGLFGALLLGGVLFGVFLWLGWVYDTKGKMWSQKIQAITERDPYQYVPNFKRKAIDYPLLYSLVNTLLDLSESIGASQEVLKELGHYLDSYFSRDVNKEDVFSSIEHSDNFMKNHGFESQMEELDSEVPLGSKAKLSFETNMLRIGWIQSLTGLLQDVLVFGSFYVVILFPDVPSNLELFYAVFGISIPLLIGLSIAGWYYDRQLKVWSADIAVKVERNPFSYILDPRLKAFVVPFLYALLATLHEIANKMDIQTKELVSVIEYLDWYTKLNASKEKDLEIARGLAKSKKTIFVRQE